MTDLICHVMSYSTINDREAYQTNWMLAKFAGEFINQRVVVEISSTFKRNIKSTECILSSKLMSTRWRWRRASFIVRKRILQKHNDEMLENYRTLTNEPSFPFDFHLRAMSRIEYLHVTCARPALKVISQYGRWGIARQACTSHPCTTSRENFTSGFLKRCFLTNVGCFQGFHVIGFASCWRYRRMVAPLSLR
ncbi:hypothetical protein V1478_018343 [Vespula squamosa]|uniref:Uncharacterized protein n=1 Tax=Vespula squamosa TaxID=30214 RepID=A0ABD1ZUR4_VESSQ